MEQSLIDCFHNDKSLFCLIGSPGLLLMTLEWEYDDVIGMGIEGQIRYILPHYPERARKKKKQWKGKHLLRGQCTLCRNWSLFPW